MSTQKPIVHHFSFSEAERLLLASDLLNFGVWEFEFSTSKLIWDNNMHKIYGVEKEDFHQNIEDFRKRVHPEDLPDVDAALREIIRAREPIFEAFRIIRPDREIRFIKGNLTCIRNADRRPVRLIGINHDITDQQKNQNKIQEQNIQLKKIAWMQSHEIRKSVANIIGLLQLYELKKNDLSEIELFNYLKISATELDIMIKIIIERTKDTEL